MTLHKSQALEQLIQSPVTPGKDHKGMRVFGKHHFSDKEVFKVQKIIYVFIGYLLLTNDLTFLIEKGYEVLEFLNYEEIITQYL